MEQTDTGVRSLELDVANVGGIDEASLELQSGVTVLKGKNATNRTSFLQALMAGMGSDRFNLKGDADRGRVRLALGDAVVEREFDRRDGGVGATGAGYLDDPELADLFAFLLEANEARRAVARGENLREIITRPIDTDEITAEIERLQAEKRRVDERLERIEERERDLVDLEQRKTRLESDVEERRDRLEELEAEIEETDADLHDERGREGTDERLDELKSLRSDLDDVRFQMETTEEAIDSLRSERDEKQDALDDLTVDPDADVDALREDLDDLRERKRRIDAQVNELQRIIQFNEEMLDGTDSEIGDVLRDGEDDGAVTDELLASEESVVCWTCGSAVSRGDVESTLDRLRSFRTEKLADRRSIADDVEETQQRISDLERTRDELERLNRRLTEIDDEIERKRGQVEDLERRREEIHEEIEALEAAVEREQSSEYDRLLDLHRQANETELELEQKAESLASVEDERAEIESLLDDREELEDRRDQISEQLEELRNRIDRLEENAVEEFNARMADVLDILAYENIARIWIERRERETRRGRRTVTEGHFELHVVRESESGGTYEGTVETLSESEREVTGLVFALAGYLVYDLHEAVPVMVLDSLEAIDSDRIARLVAYFAEYPEFLVIALLPEDADAIDIDHETVTEID